MIKLIIIITIISIVGLIIGTIKKSQDRHAKQLLIQYIDKELEERKKQQNTIDYLQAKIDNLEYISELTENELQRETDSKKILILRKQLQTIDDKIFNTETKLYKELERLDNMEV